MTDLDGRRLADAPDPAAEQLRDVQAKLTAFLAAADAAVAHGELTGQPKYVRILPIAGAVSPRWADLGHLLEVIAGFAGRATVDFYREGLTPGEWRAKHEAELGESMR
jgi:hypothetical protein